MFQGGDATERFLKDCKGIWVKLKKIIILYIPVLVTAP